MNHKSDSQGFALVELLLIVVIVAVLGFVGWYVWHQKQSKPSASTSTTQTSNSNTAKSSNESSSSNNGKLYIQAWGVSFGYDNSKVTLETQMSSDGSQAKLTSKELATAAPGKCDLNSASGLGYIVRGKPTDTSNDFNQTFQQVLDKNPTLAGKLGDYIYAYVSPKSACDSSSVNAQLVTQTNEAAQSILK